MKRLYLLICLPLMLTAGYMYADNQGEDCQDRKTKYQAPNQADGQQLYFFYDVCDNIATVIRRSSKKTPYYVTSSIVIPSTLTVTSVSGSMNGFSGGEVHLPVVEIADSAFNNATSSSFSFKSPSNIKIIRHHALINMANMTGTLELPEGLTTLEEGAIETGFTTLIIPSTIETLGLSSLVLNKVEKIVFLGTTPPVCSINGDLTPWNNVSNATPKKVTIEIPEGSFDDYLATAGIGDYFTYFTGEEEEISTGVAETATTVKHGIYSVFGVYLGEDAANLPKGIYIIDGKKVIR